MKHAMRSWRDEMGMEAIAHSIKPRRTRRQRDTRWHNNITTQVSFSLVPVPAPYITSSRKSNAKRKLLNTSMHVKQHLLLSICSLRQLPNASCSCSFDVEHSHHISRVPDGPSTDLPRPVHRAQALVAVAAPRWRAGCDCVLM